MATHKSALKRARQNETRKIRNRTSKTRSKSAVGRVRSAVAAGSADRAEKELAHASRVLQKSASKGVIHKNTAARKISRLTRQVNQLNPSAE